MSIHSIQNESTTRISTQCCCAPNGSQWTDNTSQYNPKSILFIPRLIFGNEFIIIIGKYNKKFEWYSPQNREIKNIMEISAKFPRNISSEM